MIYEQTQNIDRNKHGKFGATEVKISSLVHERKLILRKRFLKICVVIEIY